MPGEWGWGRWTPGILWRAHRIESERTSDSGSLPCHGFLPQNRRKCAFFKKVIRRQEIVVCVGVLWDAQKSHSYPSHCKASSALDIYRQLRTWLSLSFPNPHSLCCFSFLHFPNSSLSYLGNSRMFENSSGGGAFLVVQGLRLHTQCRSRYNPWLGN